MSDGLALQGYQRTIATELLQDVAEGRKDQALRQVLATSPSGRLVLLWSLLDVFEALALRCPAELRDALEDVYGVYLLTAWPLDLDGGQP